MNNPSFLFPLFHFRDLKSVTAKLQGLYFSPDSTVTNPRQKDLSFDRVQIVIIVDGNIYLNFFVVGCDVFALVCLLFSHRLYCTVYMYDQHRLPIANTKRQGKHYFVKAIYIQKQNCRRKEAFIRRSNNNSNSNI